MNDLDRHQVRADGEIFQGPLRLRAPVTVVRNFDLAEAVAFEAHGRAPFGG